MTVPLGPAGALKIAYELIDAQAEHIKNLERGHWSRETRALVSDKRDELDAVQAAAEAGSCCAAGACDPCEQIEVTTIGDAEPRYIDGGPHICSHGFHPTSCGYCTGPAAAYTETDRIIQAGVDAMAADGAARYREAQRRHRDHICNPACREELARAATGPADPDNPAVPRRESLHNHELNLRKRDGSCPGCRP